MGIDTLRQHFNQSKPILNVDNRTPVSFTVTFIGKTSTEPNGFVKAQSFDTYAEVLAFCQSLDTPGVNITRNY